MEASKTGAGAAELVHVPSHWADALASEPVKRPDQEHVERQMGNTASAGCPICSQEQGQVGDTLDLPTIGLGRDSDP